MNRDIRYTEQTIKRNQSDFKTLENSARNKTISFGSFSWFGFLDSIAPSSVPEGYGLISFNNKPKGSSLESPFGYREVGFHNQNQFPIDLEDWEGLLTGEFYPVDQKINLKRETGLFKILKNKVTSETNFWILNSEGDWELRNPISTYWKQGQVNTINPDASVNEVYNFKGNRFNYVVWKNILYLCSGEENFVGSSGKTSGLMKFDGNNWDSILTGDAGFLGNKNIYVNKSLYKDDGSPQEADARLYDSGRAFNPSLICLFKDKLHISGAESNPLQVKVSEMNNPDNFVDNVLTIQSIPLTTKDTARPSSFIIGEGCDFITSLNVYNNVVYIGTNKHFYIYDLVESNLQDGQFFQLDAIIQNNFTPAGPRSSYATTTFANRLYYVSDYQVIPEISCFELTYSNASGTPSASYRRLSSDIEDFLPDFEIGNSTIGIFGDKILIGLKRKAEFANNNSGEESIGNDITLVASPFSFSTSDQRLGFTILDYIAPTYFYTNNSGCYFVTKDNGRVYKITEDIRGVKDEEQGLVEYPTCVWRSGWTGYNPAKDSSFSLKSLKNILISGYFSEDTEMIITFLSDDYCKGDIGCDKSKTWYYKFTKKDLIICEDCFEDTNLSTAYKNKAPYYGTLMFKIPLDADGIISYKKISWQIEIMNSRYFMLESVSFIATEVSATNNDTKVAELISMDRK